MIVYFCHSVNIIYDHLLQHLSACWSSGLLQQYSHFSIAGMLPLAAIGVDLSMITPGGEYGHRSRYFSCCGPPSGSPDRSHL